MWRWGGVARRMAAGPPEHAMKQRNGSKPEPDEDQRLLAVLIDADNA